MRSSVIGFGLLGVAFATATARAADEPTTPASWARWQGRVALGYSSGGLRIDPTAFERSNASRTSVTAMGDYYFAGAVVGARQVGGFRATSGVAFGPRSEILTGLMPSASGGAFSVDRRLYGPGSLIRSPLGAATDNTTISYVGIGYTGLTSPGGWSFSADIGVVSLRPSSGVKLGRVFSGSQSADDLSRDLRLSPVLQIGASYAF
ncbi:hypothetical protein [Piscinibacter koreensis]|uniref:Outer membrane protein n=1 Tax=Piscinibacter koreensis TaxID=2742824 RepID=A0A7Y6NM16_9BURK|nr:hypothetical protein [Schlegelella koreensis]NUZ05683.1 hypothetical protein [Schlegelella koreensis]